MGHNLPLKLLLLVGSSSLLSHQLELDHCHQELGAAAGGELEDSAFTASSSYDEASVGPKNARLNGDRNGGAWCSASPVSRDIGTKEWLEVDLGAMHVVTAVLTQGRFGNGRGAEFTEAYKLNYWRPGMTNFIEYHDALGRSILPGNDNTYSVANNTLEPPIFAWKIRLLPFSEHPRNPCVRLEYVGCPFTEGVVSYSIPQGMLRGSTLELMDHTYDGKEDSRTGDLRGGLGQLIDGRYGYDNFKAGGKGQVKGYDWLGWKRKTNQNSINLMFAFDSVRTFRRVDIHTNNHFTKDIQVFKQAKVYFSNEEDKFGDDRAVDFKYMPDLAIENARNVSINLKGEHGQYVMLQLYFNAKWILISEVTFYSHYKEEKPFVVQKINEDIIDVEEIVVDANDKVEVALAPVDIKTYPDAERERDNSQGGAQASGSPTVGVVIGVLLTVITILLMGILFVVYRSRSSKDKRSTPTHSLLATSSKSSDRYTSSIDFKDHQLVNMQYTPYSSATTTNKLTSYEETIYEEPLNARVNISTEDLTEEYAEPGSLNVSNSIISENIYVDIPTATNNKKGIYLPPLPLSHYARPLSPQQSGASSALQSLALPPPPPAMTSTGTRPRMYSRTTPLSSSSSSNSPNGRFQEGGHASTNKRRSSKTSRTSTMKKKKESSYYASVEVQNIDLAKLYAQVNKTTNENSVQPFKRSTSIDTVNVTLNEIDKEELEVVQKLGEGQFGEIHLCRINRTNVGGLPDDLSCDLVAVKSLRRNCDEVTRSDFEHEARILTSLNDPNLVRVLGVCYDEDEEASTTGEVSIPICMVCEFTEEGDLCQFLQDHVAETTLSKSPNVPTLSYGCLIYIATQIASGMKYLESLNFVHRDLAARNCLVGPRKAIKICDFGMSKAMYKNDYYKTESGCLLPIRWMSWESLLMGKFTTKSDVWAFGVTLWEILTFAREQPHESLSDAKILSNLSSVWREGRPTIVLPSPHGCPREVRDLMTECWQRDEQERPSFREIHLFLLRKNLGYDPADSD